MSCRRRRAIRGSRPPCTIELESGAGRAHLVVRDDGPGMDEQFVRESLFRPFHTTKGSKGMGIGAYESYQYLQELGGKINVESAPGRGTKVTILLPLFFAQSGSDAGLVEAR